VSVYVYMMGLNLYCTLYCPGYSFCISLFWLNNEKKYFAVSDLIILYILQMTTETTFPSPVEGPSQNCLAYNALYLYKCVLMFW
jgi:hypothetical protein